MAMHTNSHQTTAYLEGLARDNTFAIQTKISSQKLISGITSIITRDIACLSSRSHEKGVRDPTVEVSEPKRERREKYAQERLVGMCVALATPLSWVP